MILFKKDAWQEIYFSLQKNKVRTFITMIGVGWGMFLYVTLLGLAKGMENGFDVAFENFATNGMVIWAEQTNIPYQGFPRGRSMELKLSDVDYLKEKVPEIEVISPRNVTGRWGSPPSPAVRNGKSNNYTVYGEFPEAYKVAKKDLLYGRVLNEPDVEEKRKVALIGKQVYEQLFEKDEDPIGEYIKMNGIFFKVIGVYKLPNQGGFENEESIYIPFPTFQQLYNQGDRVGWVNVLIKENEDIGKAEDKIKSLLKQKHKVHPDDEQAFGGFNYGKEFGKLTGFLKGMQFLTVVVGGLTILAGVIAISNILLITVKERTKEIGVRRALGAKPGQIRSQILLESVVITLLSGGIGFMLGVGLLALINMMVGKAEDFPFYNPTVSLWNVFGALSVMVIMGLFIGLLPAQRAVMIRPIEALRTE